MSLIWCAISSHGYGHAAQVVPVLNALARRIGRLCAILRTQVPSTFFEGRLTLPYTVSPAAQDVGCVQDGPLTIDIARTWTEHERFHESWDSRLEAEAQAMVEARPSLILSDISPLAIAAGRRAGIRTAALGSLTWDMVLEPYLSHAAPARQEQTGILNQIRGAYREAALMIRLSPGLPMPAFLLVKDVGPLVQSVAPQRVELRERLGVAAGERVAVVAFGGIPLTSLPIARMEEMAGWQFVVSGTVPSGCRRIRSAEALPFAFGTTLISGNVIVTKPGYSTVVEAVHHQVPVVYVRRYNFADEEGLVRYLHRHGRGLELEREAFQQGWWGDALSAVLRQPAPTEPAPEPRGAVEAAELLAGFF